MAMDDNYEVIETSVRDTFASVVWSHKIQEKQADIYSERFKCLETAKILSASLTSVGLVSLVFTDQPWIKLCSALISFVSVFVSTFFKSFDLQAMVSQHKAAANNLLEVRDQLKLILLQIHLKQESVQAIYKKYEGVVQQLDKVYTDSPNTTDKAVTRAREALNVSKDNTFSDDEIDSFLPIGLRKDG